MRSAAFRDPGATVRTQTQHLDELSHRLRAGLGSSLARWRRRLEPAASRLAGFHPALLAQRARGRLEKLIAQLRWSLGGRSKHASEHLAAAKTQLLAAHPRNRLRLARQQVQAAARQLEALSYRSVLKRGFSVTRTADRELLTSVSKVTRGETIQTELADGKIASTVTGQVDPAQPLRPQQKGKPKRKPQNTRTTEQGNLFDKNTEDQ
ncbi:unnamed protein product [marine sediment metagenome]|uniref:Exonuclease VII large subunit C-terminal domain-containing protein n=1 Tax=marine sediment metagenome TaxID=412755 RepID=X0TBL9_9ZZZZ